MFARKLSARLENVKNEASAVLKIKEFTWENDCFQNKSNEIIGVFLLTLNIEIEQTIYIGLLKIRFFEADKILKLEFTLVNEDFKIEVQRRKSNF